MKVLQFAYKGNNPKQELTQTTTICLAHVNMVCKEGEVREGVVERESEGG